MQTGIYEFVVRIIYIYVYVYKIHVRVSDLDRKRPFVLEDLLTWG